MQSNIITAPAGATYLSDFMTTIPENCIFNKHITGCGATELALRNDVPTIIAMPYVSLVKNKTLYRKDNLNILGVYSDISNDAIANYAHQSDSIKIATTYDSLPRVVETLKQVNANPYKDTFLLVDEWHTLFNSYEFRYSAISNLLRYASQFERATYMSATPIEPKYMLEQLRHLPITEIVWPQQKEVKVISAQTSHPDRYVMRLCREALEQSHINVHIFVNSVKFIAKIINTLQLSAKDVKIVCSQSGTSKNENQKILGANYPIEQAGDAVKRINFYTSTCFEGCDIYDPNGRTYIVSDGNKANTLFDISTVFTQICGRIRDSHYGDMVTHIFSTTRYSQDVTLDEFVTSSHKAFAEAKRYANDINSLPDSSRIKTLEKIPYLNERYIRKEDNRLVVDGNLVNMDIVNFKICRHIYRHYANLSSELQQSGYKIEHHLYNFAAEKLESKPYTQINFKELFEEYVKLKRPDFMYSLNNNDERCAIIAKARPLVKQAYDALGVERVRELNYHTGNIRREITKQMDASIEYKVVKMLRDNISHCKAIPKSRIKEVLQSIYNELGITQRAKASDLTRWFDTKESFPKINGKSVAHLTIIRDKFFVK